MESVELLIYLSRKISPDFPNKWNIFQRFVHKEESNLHVLTTLFADALFNIHPSFRIVWASIPYLALGTVLNIDNPFDASAEIALIMQKNAAINGEFMALFIPEVAMVKENIYINEKMEQSEDGQYQIYNPYKLLADYFPLTGKAEVFDTGFHYWFYKYVVDVNRLYKVFSLYLKDYKHLISLVKLYDDIKKMEPDFVEDIENLYDVNNIENVVTFYYLLSNS